MTRPALFDVEARTRAKAAFLLGVDEAGRGPLAGPVVVAAVALPEKPSPALKKTRDSKLLTPKERERLYALISAEALSVSVAWAHPVLIDRDNILAATLAAMRRASLRAAAKLPAGERLVLVDGPRTFPDNGLPQRAVVDGDHKSLCVAAASVIAKVTRDRWMERLSRRHPGYGFDVHKGYGTKSHMAALDRLGPCAAHRRSYAPVAARVQAAAPAEAA